MTAVSVGKKNHCFPFDLLITQICQRSSVHSVKDTMNYFIDGMRGVENRQDVFLQVYKLAWGKKTIIYEIIK